MAVEIGHETLIVFVKPNGIEVPRSAMSDAIELRCAGPGWPWLDIDGREWRCAGPGWPWLDIDGREWGSAGASFKGETLPRWVTKRRLT